MCMQANYPKCLLILVDPLQGVRYTMDAILHALSARGLDVVCGPTDTDPAATVSLVLQHCEALIDWGQPPTGMGNQVCCDWWCVVDRVL